MMLSKKDMSAFIRNKQRQLLWFAIHCRIFYLTCITLRSPRLIKKTLRLTSNIRMNLWGGDLKKMQKVGKKYYTNMYAPPWPSRPYDNFVKTELRRYASNNSLQQHELSFVFLAVTRKCPLRCEHCFEADNLNEKEVFSRQELLTTVDVLQQEGALQFHFSGGEPMVRMKDLVEVIRFASRKSSCWVATSGYNLTTQNAKALKEAGCAGVIVSIDHYVAEMHNLFRHHPDSFRQAVEGVEAARTAGLATAISVCTTKQFIEGGHLVPYMHFASSLRVNFVQFLEPKNVGNYSGKDVLLKEWHLKELEAVFLQMNYAAAYKDYPTLLYHGYHQSRMGCFAGSRSIYIDSVGDVHACPFCHTKSYNILDMIRKGQTSLPVKENLCPRYATVV